MSAEIARVARAFRRGLPTYGRDARAQARIAAHLAALIRAHAAPRPDRVLEFGCGTGFLTRHLLDDLTPGDFWANDLLPETADLLAPRLNAHPGRATFLPGPIQSIDLPGRLDLIASASTVQWFDDPAREVTRLCRHLAPGGLLALSGFGPDQFCELQALGSTAAAPGYVAPSEWAVLLPKGMTLLHVQERHLRLAFPDAAAVLRHLRSTGVNAGAGQIWSKGRLSRFEARYRDRFARLGALPVTYHPVYIVARRDA
ncbi:malonyl-ACP O-methyltransferase [Meridianimarinicoccus sp. MJW13]|uniref:malonyl-ACP O-methyltransferase n=1 Tax=Meridianimarinicoccus sp. MJW13 TaxID=2720031 RepID=UPI001866B787|nr:malonyl-ACP O-methyltransferase [Fluviibacterium sp. MJW13]